MNELLEQIVKEQNTHLKQFQVVVRATDTLQDKVKELQINQIRLVYFIAFYFACKVLLYFLTK